MENMIVKNIHIDFDPNRRRAMVFVDPKGGLGSPDRYRNTVLQAVADRLGFLKEDIRLNWSQTCGCKCPCSPGFFLTAKPDIRGIPEFTPTTCAGMVMTVELGRC
jgi:hypothetical protein